MQVFDEKYYDGLLKAGAVDGAWRYLSDSAEKVLLVHETAVDCPVGGSGLRRADLWKPTQQRLATANGDEERGSCRTRRLTKVVNSIKQVCKEPWHLQL